MSIKAACDFLNEKLPEDTEIDEALDEFNLTGEQVFKDIQKALSKRKSTSTAFALNENDDEDDGDANEKENHAASNARGARGGRSTAASKQTTAAAAKKPAAASGRGRGSSRSTTSRTAAAAAPAGPSARNGPNTTVLIQIIKFNLIFHFFKLLLTLIIFNISGTVSATAHHTAIPNTSKHTSTNRYNLRN